MPIHFVLRIPLMTRVNGRSFSTIEAHNDVAKKNGRLAIAKFGNPGTTSRVTRLDGQIKQGIETRLILIVKQDDRFFGYESRLIAVHHGKPGDLASFAPPYYAETGETPLLWFAVNSPFARCDLAQYRLVTNRRPLLHVISECRTATMLVETAK